MAGGMSNRNRETLAQRTASTRADGAVRPPVDPAAPGPGLPAAPRIRHCWISGAHGRLPGLLLAWEQRADGWHGRVVHPVEEHDGWVVVEEWLPAGRLERADV